MSSQIQTCWFLLFTQDNAISCFESLSNRRFFLLDFFLLVFLKNNMLLKASCKGVSSETVVSLRIECL